MRIEMAMRQKKKARFWISKGIRRKHSLRLGRSGCQSAGAEKMAKTVCSGSSIHKYGNDDVFFLLDCVSRLCYRMGTNDFPRAASVGK